MLFNNPFTAVVFGVTLGFGLSLGIIQTANHQLVETRAQCARLDANSPTGRWCADNGFAVRGAKPNHARQASLVGWR